MAIKLSTTKISATSVKALVYGQAGVGKTRLCCTAPKPIIISAEAGLLSLAEQDIPAIIINGVDDLAEAFLFITTNEEGMKFQTICLDSITDIAEVVLSDLKIKTKDPRAAYGDLADKMGNMIRSFRDLPDRNIYFTAKVKRVTDELGVTQYVPSMPGQQLVTNLPYWFDLVMAMRIGTTEEGVKYRYLQTQPDIYWEAKDRSGRLNEIEEPNLTKLFAKIIGKNPSQDKEVPLKTEAEDIKTEAEEKDIETVKADPKSKTKKPKGKE